MHKEIIHNYNVIFIRTTRNNPEIVDTLLNMTIAKQINEGEDSSVTELTRLHYENKEMPIDYAVEIFDLMESLTKPYLASSIYIQYDYQHSEQFRSLIKSNPNYIKGDVEIKLATHVGYVQIN